MGFVHNIGKYQLERTIGEGNFAKVKLAVDSTNGHHVAIKIIDKHMVMKSNLKSQVHREIRTMKLLHHPNIVRIHEVIGSKSKIYLVMEYVSGGQLSDRMSFYEKLGEKEGRKIFQQLIDAVDYCHNKGVYHRDLKPENLLLDQKGNLKISDFGLSAFKKPGGLLTTACGSPSYVAPELLANRGYDGAAADVWSCGIVLFELLAGCLPFEDRNLMSLYKKISRADYAFPNWFSEGEKRLISRILEPEPRKRITISEIIEDPWFQEDYIPTYGYESEAKIYLDDDNDAFDSIEHESIVEAKMPKPSSFINAFQLIAMSNDLDLSGLFEGQDEHKQKSRFGSKLTAKETIEKIKVAATDSDLSVEKINNFRMKIHPKHKMARCSRSHLDLSAVVIEVGPNDCVIEVSKSAGELELMTYDKFCNNLTNLLTTKPDSFPELQPLDKIPIPHEIPCSGDS